MDQPQLAYKNDLRFGDVIVVFNPKSLLHRLIDKITGQKTPMKAGHVAMYYEGIQIIEAASSGVGIKPCKNYTPNHILHVKRYAKMDVPEIMLLEKAIKDSVGERYSFFQLPIIALSYLLRKNMPDVSKKAVICSELVAGFYKKIGKEINRKTPQNVSPIDFLIDKDFKTVFMYKP